MNPTRTFPGLFVLAMLALSAPLARASELIVQTATVTRTFMVMAPPTVTTNAPGGLTGSLTGGLLAYWPLDEAQGGVAHDISGNNHDGTISGGVTLNQGFGGMAGMSFDGTDAKVTCPGVVPSGAAPRSLSAWVQHADGDLGVPVGIASFNGCGTNFRLLSGPSAGQLYVDVGCNYVLSNTGLSGPHHLAATFDGTTLALYLDGALAGTEMATPNTTAAGLLIGNDAEDNYFSGHIAGVGVWNRALTAQEVTDLYLQTGSGLAVADTNILLRATGTAISLSGDVLIESLVPQGDLSMGRFTSKP